MTKKLKILMLSDPLFRPSGYGNTNLSQLSFLREKFDMAYLCWGWNGLEPTYNELSQFFPGIEFYPALGQYHGKDVLHHVILKSNPDIILLHGDLYMFVDNLRDELARYKGKICQIALYPLDGENIPNKWVSFMEKLDGLICLTDWGKKETQRCVNVPVEVAPLGIDPLLFHPVSKEEKIKLRREKFQFWSR